MESPVKLAAPEGTPPRSPPAGVPGSGETAVQTAEPKLSQPQSQPTSQQASEAFQNPEDTVKITEIDFPELPSELEPFDWDNFRHRYEAALQEAHGNEVAVLKETEALAQYFKVWASAASSHDDERAVKRLRSQQRFVNLAENRMEQKQEHYEQVVQAFENALALLRAT